MPVERNMKAWGQKSGAIFWRAKTKQNSRANRPRCLALSINIILGDSSISFSSIVNDAWRLSLETKVNICRLAAIRIACH